MGAHKTCSLVTWEVQIKTTIKYYGTCIRILKTIVLNAGEAVKQLELVHIAGSKMKQLLWIDVWQFVIKLNIYSPYDSAIPFLDICPKEMKTYVRIKTCTQIFIAALFTIAKN